MANGRRVKMHENPLTELFDSWKPIGVPGNRRATDRQLNVLKLSVRRCWSGIETRKAIEARDFSQPVHRDDVLYCREIDICSRIGPNRSRERLRV
jgi:hypothetical protein